VIMCGGGGPGTKPSKAIRTEDGGFQVWGQSTFISGCHNAEWCFMAAPVFNGDEVERLEDGSPHVRMFFLHRSQWTILDTWDVAGLRGSGSHDVLTEGGVVPPKHANVGLVTFPAHYPNPVYRIPVPLRLAYNKAAVALGVAKGALEAFTELATTKVPFTTNALLRDRPIAQHRMGEATAMYRSARAYLFEAMGQVTDELEAGRELPSAEATQNARLACTHAANVCMAVVDLIHNTSGTSGMRMSSPLERKLRDAHGCATHRWVAHPLYGELGKILLGHEPGPEFDGSAGQAPRATTPSTPSYTASSSS
jgi:alkylation response protein AidB-like acyl-CoA dehydrogenase